MLVDITERIPVKTVLPSIPKRPEAPNEKQAAQDAKMITTVTIFTPDGNHLLTASDKGWFNIIDAKTLKVIYSTRICTSMIVFLRLTASGGHLVVNARDGIVRKLKMPTNLSAPDMDPDKIHLEVEQTFQNVVNKSTWNSVSFSSTGEFIAAALFNQYEIHIWESQFGSLCKLLLGPKEEHIAIEWHPAKPLIVSVGMETGRIHLWTIEYPQAWSALAPDFREVEENVEYIENEDDFDIHPQEEVQKRVLDLEDDDVDLHSITPIPGAIPDEVDEFKMPVLLDLDLSDDEEELVEVGAGTWRRKH
jgi:COMPASS component SWD1